MRLDDRIKYDGEKITIPKEVLREGTYKSVRVFLGGPNEESVVIGAELHDSRASGQISSAGYELYRNVSLAKGEDERIGHIENFSKIFNEGYESLFPSEYDGIKDILLKSCELLVDEGETRSLDKINNLMKRLPTVREDTKKFPRMIVKD